MSIIRDKLMEMTIGDLVDMQAEKYPDNDCIVYPLEENIRWTYSEFRDICNKVARGMLAMGIKKGDHVAIWATNVPEWLILQYCSCKIGCVLVTVNTNYKQFELEYLLRQSDTSTLFMVGGIKGNDYLQHIRGICKDLGNADRNDINEKALPMLKRIVFIGAEENTPAGMYNFNEIYGFAQSVSQSAVDEIQRSLDIHDVINMQYTSGTTGFPKGVMLTHYNVLNNGLLIGDCMELTEKDRLCIPVPLFHCFGCVLGSMAAMTHGTTMVMVDHFNPIHVMEAVQREKCTGLHGVPTMFISILNNERFDDYDFSSLRTGIMAGSPCPIKVMREVNDRMNMSEITIAYGLTESSPVFTQTRTDDPMEMRVSTVGKQHPFVEVKIASPETGEEVGFNVPGEIMTRGYHIMKGYYKMPEATKLAVTEDGWLHTGDLGTVDEEGYYKITGRLKDMIIRGGENIYPRELEEFYYTHPKVKDVQVVGVPDVRYGEEVMAYIVLSDGETSTEEEMIEFARQGLSKFKAPRYVRFIDGYPTTASGKIQKYILREMGIKDLGLEEVACIETA